jgi:exopolyphosphatase / guanosine-5'-triphosphate,3'-diphosphate pyrophosphatase
MRVAVIDMGSNSTRLLVADVAGTHVEELARRSTVTRLGQGVDASGALADDAIARVIAALDDYRAVIDGLGDVQRIVGVMTSAVRDAANGPDLLARVRDDYGIDARVLTGDEEARLTFAGAISDRPPAEGGRGSISVIDIGGGSTEVVVGTTADDVSFHVSMQLGVVRHSERFIHTDPPEHEELEALSDDVRAILHRELPESLREQVTEAIAVAGTATSAAAIALEARTYDPDLVHGYLLPTGVLEELIARLAQMTDAERRHVPGLHPDRAPTIVAGLIILLECARALELDVVEVSEHDILRGAALDAAHSGLPDTG